MLRSLYTAASGMLANQLSVDSISNNLANVNTAGYKKSRVEFQDLLYQTMIEPGGTTSEGTRLPESLQVGLGVKSVGNPRNFAQGNLTQTGNPWDVAIQGEGFFQVRMPDQTTGFTRDGSFKVNADGFLVTANGYYTEPQIQVPANSSNPTVGPDGRVTVVLQGESDPTEIGQLEIAQFVNASGLRSIGQNLYQETEASGRSVVGTPGENGSGSLATQYLESSNVQLVEEMVNLIIAQRAYEISSKAVTTSDTMLQTANNLKS
ncbi:MAG: flagellar basal-body rod protein FlgG [Fibrobacterota bacterium]|nr:flagellar basal-body rod protein FlgG [Fibrobacterota bacterium]QQS07297.1 MAG: flagellar basal-body rod protein FlgG [Fibrobacterota bacterium]